MAQQFGAYPRILYRNHVGTAQYLSRPWREVTKVADGASNDIKAGFERIFHKDAR